MDIFSWIRLFIRHWKYTVVLPVIAAALTVYFTKDITREYKSNALVYTAVGTGYDVLSDPTANIDRFGTMVNFDNLVSTINSRTCLETSTLKLLAWRLTTPEQYNSKDWKEETKLLTAKLSENVLKQARSLSEKEMFEFLKEQYTKNLDPQLVTFIETVPSNYNIDRIRTTLKVKQRLSSDMLELIYTSNIPVVTERTLTYLIQSFRETYLGLKSKEAQDVVDYYEKQLNAASNRLKLAEERRKNFGAENRIINIEEQSKNLANAREETQAELFLQQSLKASAQSAIARLEKQIGDQAALYNFSKQVIPNKDRLTELSYTISSLEITGDTNSSRYKTAKEEYDELVGNSKLKLRQYSGGTEGGMSKRELMAKWLDNVLELNKAESKIRIIESRLKSFDESFQKFAPLGSTLDQLERESTIAEETYKEILRSYNTAVLKLKDTQISNALSVVDPPFVPQNAQPSKRLQMVVLAALVTFILVGCILIAITYFDNSIKSIDRIKNFTGNEVIAAVPYYDYDYQEINWKELKENQQLNIGNSVLAYFSKAKNKTQTKFLGLTSNQEQEGKHFVAQMLLDEFTRLGFQTKVFSPKEKDEFYHYRSKLLYQFLNPGTSEESSNKNIIRDKFAELLGLNGHEDFVIFIFPPFNASEIPLPLLNSLDIQLKMVDATREWTKSDDYLHQLNKAPEEQGFYIILNNMNPWQVEEIYGEIPRKRTWLRKRVKKVFAFLVGNRSGLNS
ncbi:MAG: GumC family protein [Luteibaculum sp.]